MPRYAKYPTPHLLGRIDYSGPHRFKPDGDTVHLLDVALLLDGKLVQPKDKTIEVWMPGNQKARRISVKGSGTLYVPIRFEGTDAPEEHYKASAFKVKKNGKQINYPINPQQPHQDRSQPRWKPATDYVLSTLQKAGWALIQLDSEVVDKYGRVLGYVYASDKNGARGTFITEEVLRRGLSFPFIFESARDFTPILLQASRTARKQKLGVWKNYADKPLAFSKSFPAPDSYTDPEPAAQASAPLNLPVVFRRVVDVKQLTGLTLKEALRKYDAIDFETGDLVTGDRYTQIPIDNRIWAPHSYA